MKKTLDIKHQKCYNVYEKEKETPQTRKVTIMKKATLKAIVDYIVTNDVQELSEIKDELVTELRKGEAKAEANRQAYAEIRTPVIEAIRSANAPVTAQEIADATGISRGKIVYGLTNLWTDEVVKDSTGKTSTYTLA